MNAINFKNINAINVIKIYAVMFTIINKINNYKY